MRSNLSRAWIEPVAAAGPTPVQNAMAMAGADHLDDPANVSTAGQIWHGAHGVNSNLSDKSCLPANPSVSVAPAVQAVDPAVTGAAVCGQVTRDVTANGSIEKGSGKQQLTTPGKVPPGK